jgi:hypothetical protein
MKQGYLGQLLGVQGQQVECPRQHGGRGLMAGHKHAEQIVPQLGGGDLLAAGYEEAQHAGVRLVHVPLLEGCLHASPSCPGEHTSCR